MRRTCTEIEGEWLLDVASHYYDLDNFPKSGTLATCHVVVVVVVEDMFMPDDDDGDARIHARPYVRSRSYNWWPRTVVVCI